jgi:hypothetical protein
LLIVLVQIAIVSVMLRWTLKQSATLSKKKIYRKYIFFLIFDIIILKYNTKLAHLDGV